MVLLWKRVRSSERRTYLTIWCNRVRWLTIVTVAGAPAIWMYAYLSRVRGRTD